jgi:glycosyltransferase involved in cell wall biosynthesis
MRILMLHNSYQQPGGEDQVFAAEARSLEQHGNTVVRMSRKFTDLENMGKVAIARDAVWSRSVYREVSQTIREERIDVAHFHNIFPLISPSAYYAARAQNVPVVQSLHNFRLLCPGGLLYREGGVCEACVGHAPWRGVQHGCYRGSMAQSAALAGMLSLHRWMGTWGSAVNIYLALTEFARHKFVQGGLPQDKIRVKPNFLNRDPGLGAGASGFALFVGRITEDKGVQVMIDAWRQLNPRVPLKIVGDGPARAAITKQAQDMACVEVMGARSTDDVLSLMRAATVLIVPSLWYEGFPMTIVEAYACGLPVIASDIGGLSSVVQHNRTGQLFTPGNPAELAACVQQSFYATAHTSAMRQNARAAFETLYGPETGYRALMGIYEAALSRN